MTVDATSCHTCQTTPANLLHDHTSKCQLLSIIIACSQVIDYVACCMQVSEENCRISLIHALRAAGMTRSPVIIDTARLHSVNSQKYIVGKILATYRMIHQESRAIIGRTARCSRKFRSVSKFTATSRGFHRDRTAFELNIHFQPQH